MRYVALITGASSGIGEATVRLLHRRRPDADIIVLARRRDRIDALAAELNAAHPDGQARLHAHAADLTDPEAITQLGEYISGQFGQLNLLVNNAGARWSEPFAEGGYANVAQTMRINFDAQVQLTEALLPLIRAAVAADGVAEPTASNPATNVAIVNVASTAGRVSRPGAGAYSASKFALIGWSDALHGELKAEGIHVGLVNPGFIATEGFPQTELVSHPLKRRLVGSPEQAAAAILRAGWGGQAEVYVPGLYRAVAVLAALAPGVIRRSLAGGALTTQTSLDAQPRDVA